MCGNVRVRVTAHVRVGVGLGVSVPVHALLRREEESACVCMGVRARARARARARVDVRVSRGSRVTVFARRRTFKWWRVPVCGSANTLVQYVANKTSEAAPAATRFSGVNSCNRAPARYDFVLHRGRTREGAVHISRHA